MFGWLMNFFFPLKCPFCGNIVEDEIQHCQQCHLPWAKEFFLAEGRLWCYTPFWYEDAVKKAILRYKFSGLKQYAPVFGQFMADSPFREMTFDVITWVPLSGKRRRKRGYNQAELLARIVAAEFGTEAKPCLEKIKDTVAQSSLDSAKERKENAENVYALCGDSVEGLAVLLIDDVITTGATLLSCNQVLQQGGAKMVACLGFARAKGHLPTVSMEEIVQICNKPV